MLRQPPFPHTHTHLFGTVAAVRSRSHFAGASGIFFPPCIFHTSSVLAQVTMVTLFQLSRRFPECDIMSTNSGAAMSVCSFLPIPKKQATLEPLIYCYNWLLPTLTHWWHHCQLSVCLFVHPSRVPSLNLIIDVCHIDSVMKPQLCKWGKWRTHWVCALNTLYIIAGCYATENIPFNESLSVKF